MAQVNTLGKGHHSYMDNHYLCLVSCTEQYICTSYYTIKLQRLAQSIYHQQVAKRERSGCKTEKQDGSFKVSRRKNRAHAENNPY